MTQMRIKFETAQWVSGRKISEGVIPLDHVVGYLNGEPVFMVTAKDLAVLSNGDASKSYISTVRTEQPNAYRAWSAEEDTTLTLMWAQRVPMREQEKRLGRRAGAIKARARKLKLRRAESGGTSSG